MGDTSLYGLQPALYKGCVAQGFTIGDVIRKARSERRWSQTRLGKEAERLQIRAGTPPIDKSTVSKVEREPYTSELGTIWRLLAALDLTFANVEDMVDVPFLKTEQRADGSSRPSKRARQITPEEKARSATASDQPGRRRSGATPALSPDPPE